MNSEVKEFKRRVENEYFTYNGKRYPAGTRFMGYIYEYGKKSDKVMEITFHGYDFGDQNTLSLSYTEPSWKVNAGAVSYFHVKREEIDGWIIKILPGNYYVDLVSKLRHTPEFEIPEMIIGWIIYIVVMLGLFIFKDRIVGWTFASIYFFWWRHHKLTEEYYYFDK